jgi:hypothetical protein
VKAVLAIHLIIGALGLFFTALYFSDDRQPFVRWKRAKQHRESYGGRDAVLKEKEALDEVVYCVMVAVANLLVWELMILGWITIRLWRLGANMVDTFRTARQVLSQPDAGADKHKAFQ